MSVQAYLDSQAKAMGGKMVLTAYARLEKGEGLEKRSDNFADEVASMIK